MNHPWKQQYILYIALIFVLLIFSLLFVYLSFACLFSVLSKLHIIFFFFLFYVVQTRHRAVSIVAFLHPLSAIPRCSKWSFKKHLQGATAKKQRCTIIVKIHKTAKKSNKQPHYNDHTNHSPNTWDNAHIYTFATHQKPKCTVVVHMRISTVQQICVKKLSVNIRCSTMFVYIALLFNKPNSHSNSCECFHHCCSFPFDSQIIHSDISQISKDTHLCKNFRVIIVNNNSSATEKVCV